MKKILFSLAAMALFTFGCSSNTTNEEGHEHGPDSHQHEATTEEAHGHLHNEDGSHQQEEFTIEGDSVKVDTTSTSTSSHKHDGQEEHQH